MFQNYLITALRNLTSNKLSSAINIGGLAVGLAACILIFLFVRDELGYDSFWPDADQLFRLEMDVRVPGRMAETVALIGGVAAPALKKDFNEIQDAVRLFPASVVIGRKDQVFFEDMAYADAGFFDVFDVEFIQGDRNTALADIRSVVISERIARKYFGAESPLGKPLEITRDGTKNIYTVSGVFAEVPEASHLKLNLVAPLHPADFVDANGMSSLDHWTLASVYTYVRFKPAADVDAIQSQLDAWVDANAPQPLADAVGGKVSALFSPYLISVQDIHLQGSAGGEMKPGGDMRMVQSFIAIAALILLISSLNFINLTTARSVMRSKEICLRKVMGAYRRQIIVQFLSETLVVMTIATVLALLFVQLALPVFDQLVARFSSGQSDTLMAGFDVTLLGGLACLVIVVTFAAGFYPSFVVSSFLPAKVLKSGKAENAFSGKLRVLFVVVQFAISIGLIISTAVIWQQTHHARTLDLGYEHENVLVLRGMDSASVLPRLESLARELEKLPVVERAAASDFVPFDAVSSIAEVHLADDSGSQKFNLSFRFITPEFFDAYGIRTTNGRNFSRNIGSDRANLSAAGGQDGASQTESQTASVIINESAVQQMGFGSSEAALNSILRLGGEAQALRIIGVVPDIHLKPVTHENEPTLFMWDETAVRALSIRFKTTNLSRLVGAVEDTWKRVVPGVPIKHQFLSEQINSSYVNVEARGRMFAVFSVLAILVSSLGLYGLASFTAQRRIKEIGIRKVMGASTVDILKLMLWQFSRPILVANLIAWPVAWLLMNAWLENFVFRIQLSPLLFIGGGVVALLIGWLTVGGQTWMAARSRPVNALRYE